MILDAAVELFIERSPDDADEITLQDIATRAGVSRRTVYVHFASRPSLLVTMAQHFDAAGILDMLIQRVLDAPSAADALDAIAYLHAEYSAVAYPVARVLMAGRWRDAALRAAWDDRMSARRGLYAAVVGRLAGDKLLEPEWDVESATDVVWAMTSWQVWEQLVIERGWTKERYREHLAVLLHRSLVGQRSPR